MTAVSRRNALRAVTAGGLGLAAAAVSTGQAAAMVVDRPADPPRSVEFTLIGSDMRAVGGRRNVGDQAVLTGAIHRSGEEEPTGEFFGQSTVVNRRNLLTHATGTMQTHTFVLPGGSLVGTGVLSHQGTGTFAVIGGTGVYQGFSGSYLVQQDLDDFVAGATFTFSIDGTFSIATGKAYLS